MTTIFDDFISKSKQEKGGTLFANSNSVLSFPSLSLRYLLGVNGFVFGKIYMIVGEPGCNKTSFGYYLSRLFCSAGGCAFIVDTEGANYPNIKETLGEYINKNKVIIEKAQQLETWQEAISKLILSYKKKNENFPLLIIVDSLVGGLDSKTIKRMEKQRAASLAFSFQPKLLSDYIRFLCEEIADKNIVVLFINHQTKFTDLVTGVVHRQIPGGERIKYMTSVIIEMLKLKGPVKYANRTENVIKFTVLKNRFGPEKTQIIVPWTYRNDIKSCYFDFHVADLLFMTEAFGLPASHKKVILPIIENNIKIKTLVGKRKSKLFYSDELNIDKDNALPLREFIDKFWNSEIKTKIEKEFNIKEFNTEFQPVCFDLNKNDSVDLEAVDEEGEVGKEDSNLD